MKTSLKIFLASFSVAILSASGGGFADFFKSKTAVKAAPTVSALSQHQAGDGLKEALGKGVQQAIASLGKENGFLGNLDVKIPMPESLQKIEKGLRAMGQEKYADQFVTTMNRAAEQAVPEAAAVLGDSIKQMTIEDAKKILTGADNAATDYFRRTSGAAIRHRLLPIVKAATEKVGVTSAYKQMAAKAGPVMGNLGGSGAWGGLGSMGGKMLGGEMPDLDAYITDKALDGLFLKIAEQEKLIRENPVARTTDLLKTVFGSLGK